MKWRLFLVLLLWLMPCREGNCNPWNGKVVLQGFWWDYWNNNYPNNWSTYLADLAPRLREMGIDAVWIPPTVKNKNATGSVGYSPFDHYDLGDKFQGGSTATRFGTRDEYLRAVAILHANGIEVIQDLVWNHMDGAGSDTGAGGEDPAALSNKWKNFRYASYATPATSNDAANYGGRRGRFPKNWQNFHPNPDHNIESDDITAGFFGPDICYYSNARGLSSNMSYNPSQEVNYMRNGMRRWNVWMKKQTGVDGFRLDATKHFETWATQDFLWNLAFNAGFASGGSQMFAVGEFVGSRDQLDGWIDAVNSANGGTADLVGTFDFSLRGALKGVIDSLGAANLGALPGAQQNRRSRTVPFVNNHDTFRPVLDASGRYVGWNSGSEIGGHIDPNDPRIQLAYAVALAVDGSPQIFFEDLFDLHSTGRRWTHHPTNSVHLPARDWLANQVWCHQKLNFKDGAYKVRWQASDLLVIERSARALIAVNDHFTAWQTATVQTDFGANVWLHDYSGANAADVQTDATGRVALSVPPCNGSNVRRGYAIWGPRGIDAGFSPAAKITTQEWEMADDLGDSHPSSLRQGGALPGNSTAARTVGRFYPAAGTSVRIEGFATLDNANWRISVLANGIELTNMVGPHNLVLNFTPAKAEYHTLQVQNVDLSNPTQTVWVKAIYTSPRSRLSTPPVITRQPTNIFVVVGSTAIFEVEAAGNPMPTFNWAKAGQFLPTQTASTLVIPNVTVADAGTYSVRVLNEVQMLMSASATLTVYADGTPELTEVRWAAPDFSFRVAGKEGLRYQVEKSSDLVSWVSLQEAIAPFEVRDAALESHQFYRVRVIQ